MCIFLGFSLVAEKKECSGAEENKGRMKSIEQCADACNGVSTMFIFGTNDFVSHSFSCNDNGCKCWCETSAKDDGTCDIIKDEWYRLYKLTEFRKNWIQIKCLLTINTPG